MKALTVIAALPYPNRPRDRELWAGQTAEVETDSWKYLYLFIYLFIYFSSSFPPHSGNLIFMQVYSFVAFLPHFLSNYFILFSFTCQNTWANSLCDDLPLLLSLMRQDAATTCLQSLCHGNHLGIFTCTQAEKTTPEMPWTSLALLSGAAKQGTSPAHKHGPFTPFISGLPKV